MTTIRTLLDQALQALDGLIKWDSGRDFIVPYRVRDPIHDAAKAIRTELAKPDSAPAWHDAPTCAGMWVRVPPNGGVHLVDVYGVPHTPDGARWYGPISPDTGNKS